MAKEKKPGPMIVVALKRGNMRRIVAAVDQVMSTCDAACKELDRHLRVKYSKDGPFEPHPISDKLRNAIAGFNEEIHAIIHPPIPVDEEASE